MTAAMDNHPLPWTEDEYFALGETPQRIELFDGSLFVSPVPSLRHQTISSLLYLALRPAARAAGHQVFQAVNVRLKTGRVPIPDLVVAEVGDPDGSLVTAEELLLVCEIVSPSNAVSDRVTKMHYYAEAGIPWYLLVDPEGPLLSLFRLEGDRYVLHDEGAPRIPLRFPDPLGVEVDPASLVDE